MYSITCWIATPFTRQSPSVPHIASQLVALLRNFAPARDYPLALCKGGASPNKTVTYNKKTYTLQHKTESHATFLVDPPPIDGRKSPYITFKR